MTTAGALFDGSDRWPIVDFDAVTGGCALIIAPHPDDESLGCGGVIAASCARGQPPILVVLTDGVGSHPGSRSHPPERLRAMREAETEAAARCLGLPADRIVFLRMPDTAAPRSGPAFTTAVDAVVSLCRTHDCRAVLASWRHDPHCDHEAAALIAAAAVAVLAVPHWSYPVWGRTLPSGTPVAACTGMRVEITAWQETKRQAIRCHRSQWAGLITDDPAGFQMTPGFMALFDDPYELFLAAP